MTSQSVPFRYDIALSFAGEDRAYVEAVATELRASGISVFFDSFEQVRLWGKDLYAHLNDIYQHKARFSIVFISRHYAEKAWCKVEWRAMQARAFREHSEYILPVRFDDSEIPELEGVGFLDLTKIAPSELAARIQDKLVQAGLTVPTLLVRSSTFSVESVERVEPAGGGTLEPKVTLVDKQGRPLVGAEVVAVAENGTAKTALSDDLGIASFRLPVRRNCDILIAHPVTGGAVIPDWDPVADAHVVLSTDSAVGSLICNRTCYIPGLTGRVNVILDDHGRTYLYAENMAFDGERRSPAYFTTGVPFLLEDSDGVVVEVTVMHVRSDYSLLRYIHTDAKYGAVPVIPLRR